MRWGDLRGKGRHLGRLPLSLLLQQHQLLLRSRQQMPVRRRMPTRWHSSMLPRHQQHREGTLNQGTRALQVTHHACTHKEGAAYCADKQSQANWFPDHSGCRMRTVHDRAAAQNVCQNLLKCTRDKTRETLPASHSDHMCMHT